MFSQTSEYALRAMTCLALAEDRLTPTPELAETTKVPANYLAKVLQQLAAADLITGRRGVGGGYRLARAASTISLLDVISAVGKLERSDLSDPSDAGPRAAIGALDDTLDRVLAEIRDRLGKATLDRVAGQSAASQSASQSAGKTDGSAESASASAGNGQAPPASNGHAAPASKPSWRGSDSASGAFRS